MNLSQEYPIVAANIADAMEHLGNISDILPARMEQAATHIAAQLTAGQKLMVLGVPGTRFLGELLCYNLVFRHSNEQPALPAMMMQNGLCSDDTSHIDCKTLFRSTEALGNNGDILLLISDVNIPPLPQAFTDLYQARGITSIYIGPSQQIQSTSQERHTIYMPLESSKTPRLHEMSLFILNSLNAMIQSSVFNSH